MVPTQSLLITVPPEKKRKGRANRVNRSIWRSRSGRTSRKRPRVSAASPGEAAWRPESKRASTPEEYVYGTTSRPSNPTASAKARAPVPPTNHPHQRRSEPARRGNRRPRPLAARGGAAPGSSAAPCREWSGSSVSSSCRLAPTLVGMVGRRGWGSRLGAGGRVRGPGGCAVYIFFRCGGSLALRAPCGFAGRCRADPGSLPGRPARPASPDTSIHSVGTSFSLLLRGNRYEETLGGHYLSWGPYLLSCDPPSAGSGCSCLFWETDVGVSAVRYTCISAGGSGSCKCSRRGDGGIADGGPTQDRNPDSTRLRRHFQPLIPGWDPRGGDRSQAGGRAGRAQGVPQWGHNCTVHLHSVPLGS